MPRLRRSDPSRPGLTRRRAGKGWCYFDATGQRVTDPGVVDRIRSLAIPPAWKDVWISPWPNGHIQAVGTDAAGRRQYLYHPRWRARQDRLKHERVLSFAARLPAARTEVSALLEGRGLSRERVLAGAFRLLDLGFFRVGSEVYERTNDTHGLTTLHPDHVVLEGGLVSFSYTGKHGVLQEHSVPDPVLAALIGELKRSLPPGLHLLSYEAEGGWVELDADDVNDFLRSLLGDECSAKDFRTWHATVLAAVGLAAAAPAARVSQAAARRAVAQVVRDVARYLGNTPAVCRASYIDPRVVEAYFDGRTVAGALADLPLADPSSPLVTHGPVEEACLDLLRR